MDIRPTIVEVKDIVILDRGDGENVMIQVLGFENATAPLQVSLSKLQDFANDVLTIDPLLGRNVAPVEPPAIDLMQITETSVS